MVRHLAQARTRHPDLSAGLRRLRAVRRAPRPEDRRRTVGPRGTRRFADRPRQPEPDRLPAVELARANQIGTRRGSGRPCGVVRGHLPKPQSEIGHRRHTPGARLAGGVHFHDRPRILRGVAADTHGSHRHGGVGQEIRLEDRRPHPRKVRHAANQRFGRLGVRCRGHLHRQRRRRRAREHPDQL